MPPAPKRRDTCADYEEARLRLAEALLSIAEGDNLDVEASCTAAYGPRLQAPQLSHLVALFFCSIFGEYHSSNDALNAMLLGGLTSRNRSCHRFSTYAARQEEPHVCGCNGRVKR